jgi:hypothetical protein
MWFKVKRLDDNFEFDMPLVMSHMDRMSPDGGSHSIYAECFFGALARVWSRPEILVYVPTDPRNNSTTRIYRQERVGFIIEVKQVG